MTEHIEVSAIQSTEVPYPPSWIDRLIDRIDALPGPSRLFYAVAVLVAALLINAIFWIDGSQPLGSFDPFNTSFAFFVIYWLALYQYLSRVGSRSLRTFRPLLSVDDSELAQIDYKLATLPRRLGRLAIPLGFGLTVLTISSDPAYYGDVVPQTYLPYIGDIVLSGFMSATFFGLVIRSIRQLRMVSKLHARVTNIDLLELSPAHAFSNLTARTGVGLILILPLGYIFDPVGPDSLDIISYVGIALLSIALFVMPVIGIRDQIEDEKDRILGETSDLLRIAGNHLHNKIRSNDYEDMSGANAALGALIRERDLLEKVSTWPWDPRTIRGFASALLLPILLWLVTRLLERLL